jgi:hypothetical protein
LYSSIVSLHRSIPYINVGKWLKPRLTHGKNSKDPLNTMLHEPRAVLGDICGAYENRKNSRPSPPHGPTALVDIDFLTVEVSRSHSFRHTTLSMTPMDERSAGRRNLCTTTHIIHKRQTFMPPKEFEPAIPVSERPQIHAAIGIGRPLRDVSN